MQKRKKQKNASFWLPVFLVACFSFSAAGFVPEDVLAETNVKKSEVTAPVPKIYPRSVWSNSKYEKRTKTVWPAAHEDPKVIIIHHTATNYKSSAAKQVKKIYKYHSYTKRWGDIGYNYIIGSNGSIFEGRYGGNGSIGGHAYANGTNYNKGSIGIAVLGNYQSKKISAEALDSLKKLVAWLAENNGIALGPSVKFYGKKLDSAVIGHEDVGSTDCPGRNIYSQLSAVRAEAAVLAEGYGDYAYKTPDGDEKYEIAGGKRYSGSSRAQVVEISKTQLEAYKADGEVADGSDSEVAENHDYPSGTLVKNSVTGKYGVVENGSIRSISDDTILNTGYRASNAVTFKEEKWNTYQSGQPVGYRTGAFLENRGNYYFISGNQKRRLSIPDDQKAFIDFETAQSVDESQVAVYSDGTEITSVGEIASGAILTTNYKNFYHIAEPGVKKKVSKAVFRAAFSDRAAVKVARSLLKKYKTKGNLTYQNGSFVSYRGKYYFIESEKKRPFKKKGLAKKMGYQSATKAKTKDTKEIPQGTAIE